MTEIVIGEAFLTIAGDVAAGRLVPAYLPDAGRRLAEGVRNDRIRLCGLGAHHGGDTVLIAAALRDEDDRLTPTDSLVAAAALACEECTTLLTNDPLLLGCRPLLSRADDKGLTVREAPK